MKASWNVLKQDKEMLWFPLLASVVNIFLVVGLGVLFALGSLTFGLEESASSGSNQSAELIAYAFMFLYYLIAVFLATFAQVGIAAIARARLNGGDFTFSQGFSAAWNKIGQIFVWSLVAATVGLILRLIAERSQVLGRIVAVLLGAAWGILTFFIAPVIAFEEKGIVDSLKRSASIFRARWGETLVMNISLGFATFLIILLEVIVIAVLAYTLASLVGVPKEIVVIITILSVIIVVTITSLIQSVLQTIFKVVLYDYATTGHIPAEFPRELVEGAVKTTNPTPEQSPETPPPFVPKS